MKIKYSKGIVAILLAIVLVVSMIISTDVLAASNAKGQGWATVIYENVTIDAGGSASKVTGEDNQQNVLNQSDNIFGSSFNYYGNTSDSFCKQMVSHNRNDVFLTSDNTRGTYSGMVRDENGNYISVYENDRPVTVQVDNGVNLKFYYNNTQNIYVVTRISIASQLASYNSGNGYTSYGNSINDPNNDGKITYGEFCDMMGYVGYDNTNNVPILRYDVDDEVSYAFNLSGSTNPVTVHLEGRQNVEDWELVTYTYGDNSSYTRYVYKYGGTELYLNTETLQFSNLVSNRANMSFHKYNCNYYALVYYYDASNGAWKQVGDVYILGDDGEFTVNLPGDGMYIVKPILIDNYDKMVNSNNGQIDPTPAPDPTDNPSDDPSGNEDPVDDPSGNNDPIVEPSGNNGNIIKTDTINGVATIPDKIKGGTTQIALYVTQSSGVFRLYNPVTYEHYYTKDQNEVNHNVYEIGGWQLEGNGEISVDANEQYAVPVYRLFNKTTNTHFYTTDLTEAKTLAASGTMNYEGISHYVYDKDSNVGTVVHRICRVGSTDQLWTKDANEINTHTQVIGDFTYVGPAWRSIDV